MNSNEWNVRRASEQDADVLIEFNCAIARETEGKELQREVVTRGVQRGLARSEEVTYFVAEQAGEVIGSLMLTREWSDWRDGWLVWVQSVYVAENYRGRGVFRDLLQTAIDMIRQNPDVVGLRLYVEQENKRAQAVYARTGFSDPNYKVLERIL